MRTSCLGEHYSAFLIKRFAIFMFADRLNLLAGCLHMKTYQGLEVLLIAGPKGTSLAQRFTQRGRRPQLWRVSAEGH